VPVHQPARRRRGGDGVRWRRGAVGREGEGEARVRYHFAGGMAASRSNAGGAGRRRRCLAGVRAVGLGKTVGRDSILNMGYILMDVGWISSNRSIGLGSK
jgi:hypothetical protein